MASMRSASEYAVVGSVASGIAGEPRKHTHDIDLAASLRTIDVAAFVAALGNDYYGRCEHDPRRAAAGRHVQPGPP